MTPDQTELVILRAENVKLSAQLYACQEKMNHLQTENKTLKSQLERIKVDASRGLEPPQYPGP